MNKKGAAFIFLALIIVFAFNNCGEFDSTYSENGSMMFQSQIGTTTGNLIDKSQPIYSLQSVDRLEAKKVISFAIDSQLWAKGTVFVWEHKLGEQVLYCEQVTEASTSIVHINCPNEGILTIDLIVALPTMEEERYQVTVNVLKEGQSPIPDVPGGGVNPISGKELWLTNCVGCHASGKAGRTAMQIQSAINNNIGAMGSLSFLNQKEIQAIAEYIK